MAVIKRYFPFCILALLFFSFLFSIQEPFVSEAQLKIKEGQEIINLRFTSIKKDRKREHKEIKDKVEEEKIITNDKVIEKIISVKKMEAKKSIESVEVEAEKIKEKAVQKAEDDAILSSPVEEGVRTKAILQSNNKPVYPRVAIRRSQQGAVTIGLTVTKSGKSKSVKVLISSGYYLLDETVLSFVEQENFVPAKINGLALDSEQQFKFIFQLK